MAANANIPVVREQNTVPESCHFFRGAVRNKLGRKLPVGFVVIASK
jgi:hypothetical protein